METLCAPFHDQFALCYETPNRWMSAPMPNRNFIEQQHVNGHGVSNASFRVNNVAGNKVLPFDMSCGVVGQVPSPQFPPAEHMLVGNGSSVSFQSANNVQFQGLPSLYAVPARADLPPLSRSSGKNNGLLTVPQTSFITFPPFPPVFSSFHPFHPYPQNQQVFPPYSTDNSFDSTISSPWPHTMHKSLSSPTLPNSKAKGASRTRKDGQQRISRSESMPESRSSVLLQEPRLQQPANANKSDNRDVGKKPLKFPCRWKKEAKNTQQRGKPVAEKHGPAACSGQNLELKNSVNKSSVAKADSKLSDSGRGETCAKNYERKSETDGREEQTDANEIKLEFLQTQDDVVFDGSGASCCVADHVSDLQIAETKFPGCNGEALDQLKGGPGEESFFQRQLSNDFPSEKVGEALTKGLDLHPKQQDQCFEHSPKFAKSISSDEDHCQDFPNSAMTENWAGPAYTNSPPPSSLPLPRFPMRQLRSVSVELPPRSEELCDVAVGPGSQSAPSSPLRDAPDGGVNRTKRQGLSADVASATKSLRRILKLDFAS